MRVSFVKSLFGAMCAVLLASASTPVSAQHLKLKLKNTSPFTQVVEIAAAPKEWLHFCKRHQEECNLKATDPTTPAHSAERLTDLQSVNDFVNNKVKPRTDRHNYGVPDYWNYPDNGYGDCEDYALLKKRVLIERGWPREALLIAIVWNGNFGHSVLIARTDEGEFVLDNLRREVLLWSKTNYDYVKRQAIHDPNIWVYIDGDHYDPKAPVAVAVAVASLQP